MMPEQTTPGERFARALAQKDAPALREALAPGVRFRALTPGEEWRASSQDEVIEILLGSWYEPTDHIDTIVTLEVRQVADRVAVRYCFKGHNGDGEFLVEQQGFLTAADGRITDIALVCSGFRPIPAAAS